MPDAPDGFRYQPGSERHVIGDLAELAARVSSPMVYDRRGEVIWMERFDYGLGSWNFVSWYGTHTYKLISGGVFRGPYAVYLGTDGTENGVLEMHQFVAPPRVNKWGVEVSFAPLTGYRLLGIELRRYWGSPNPSATVWVDAENGVLKIVTKSGTVTTIASIHTTEHASFLYHNIKLVADFDTNMYVRLLFDQVEYDLSDYEMHTTTEDTYFWNDLLIYYKGRTGETDYCHIGQVILTANEP